MIESIIDKVGKRISDVRSIIFPKKPWYQFYDGIPNKLEYPDLTIYELIEKTSLNYPYYDALEYYGKRLTYKELITKIKIVASSLTEMGVKKNDRVSICMPNTPAGVIMFYAVNYVGAVANMIHPLSGEKELEIYLNMADSKLLLTIDVVYDKISKIVKNTNIKKIIIASPADEMTTTKHLIYWFFSGRKRKIIKDEKTMFWHEFLDLAKDYRELPKTERNLHDEAVILYSGGTTGEPKGIVLTDYNFNAMAKQCHLMCDPAKAKDTILSIMPIFHGFGLGVCIHTPLYIGMKCVLVPDFNGKKFHSLIKKHHPNFIVGVPTLFEALLKSNLKDLSFVRCVVSGGDNISIKLKKDVDNYLKKCGSKARVREGYGLTECTGASCLTPSNYYKEGSIGIPFPDMIYKIVKIGTTKEVAVNVDGEICISGPTVMKEYLNNKEETKKTLLKHNDGKIYLHTGDLGCMDKQGFVFFKQRIKRIIISSGYNIYPSYIEKILLTNSKIDKCVVVGIPHPYRVMVAKAYIVLKKDIKPTSAVKKSIKSYCEKHIAKYSLPYEYAFVNEIPTTNVGKVAYRQLGDDKNDNGRKNN